MEPALATKRGAMRRIRILDSTTGLAADIAPEYGGMPIFLGKADQDTGAVRHTIFRLDEQLLSMGPMLAGGMPVLFPFASRTAADRYRVDGREYHIPFHGLVKNAAFAIKHASDDAVTLWIESNPAWLESCYPFDFRLELTYRLRNSLFEAEAAVENRSDKPLPHSLGWHPYFLATDKTSLSFSYSMRGLYDYNARADRDAPATMNLADKWDDVLINPEKREFVLYNPADSYQLRCRFDDNHHALVVCTTPERSVCIEPWCGIPDSINTGRFLQWIAPGTVQRYRIMFEPSFGETESPPSSRRMR